MIEYLREVPSHLKRQGRFDAARRLRRAISESIYRKEVLPSDPRPEGEVTFVPHERFIYYPEFKSIKVRGSNPVNLDQNKNLLINFFLNNQDTIVEGADLLNIEGLKLNAISLGREIVKLIQIIEEDPKNPIYFTKDKRGYGLRRSREDIKD